MPGDVALIDFDADGLYESSDDVVPFGYPVYPQNNYALSLGGNYKGLEFSIQFVGAYNVTRNISDSKFDYERAFIPDYLLARSPGHITRPIRTILRSTEVRNGIR
jgi:hypothetical protein